MTSQHLTPAYIESSLLKLMGLVIKHDPQLINPDLSDFVGGYPLGEPLTEPTYQFTLARLYRWWQLNHQTNSIAVHEGIIESCGEVSQACDSLAKFVQCLYQTQLNRGLVQQGYQIEFASGLGKVSDNNYRLIKVGPVQNQAN